MLTPLKTSTEVDAVNNILATVGGETVTADHFDGTLSLSFTAQQAYNSLRDSMRNLMGHAWDFNTLRDVELQADGFGQIILNSTNLVDGGPSNFDGNWGPNSAIAGKDGMPGPLGYGHAYHWGNHDTQIDTYVFYQFSDSGHTSLVDEQYYTFSAYFKYHSAAQSMMLFWDQDAGGDGTRETESKLIINWNTDGTIASTVSSVIGEEGSGDTTVPPLANATIEEIGKGWHRVILTVKITAAHDTSGNYRLQISPNSQALSTYGSTYLWGPQMVKHAYVTPYEQDRYDSKYIVNVDLDPVNAGDLDVVPRLNKFELRSILSSGDDATPSMLFDRKSNSFNTFSPNAKYKAVITYFMQYEDCPEVVKSLVVAMAAKEFQMQMVGNLYVDQILTQKYLQANQGFIEYETDQNELSIFNNYDVWKIMSYQNRPTAGVQAWYS